MMILFGEVDCWLHIFAAILRERKAEDHYIAIIVCGCQCLVRMLAKARANTFNHIIHISCCYHCIAIVELCAFRVLPLPRCCCGSGDK